MNDNFAHRAAEWDNDAKIAMTQKFGNALLSHITPNKQWKALEIGAGTGLVGMQLIDQLAGIVFEDTSEAMLSVLKQKLQLSNKSNFAEIVHGEVFEYKEQDIDLAFSCMAFHHIENISETLKHLYAITKPNALVAVGDIRTEDGSFHHFEPIPHKGFDTKELSLIFENSGFNVKLVEDYNVLQRERTAGVISDYQQFILIAQRKD